MEPHDIWNSIDILGISVLNNVMMFMPRLHNGQQVHCKVETCDIFL
jgi:hypothetical protein